MTDLTRRNSQDETGTTRSGVRPGGGAGRAFALAHCARRRPGRSRPSRRPRRLRSVRPTCCTIMAANRTPKTEPMPSPGPPGRRTCGTSTGSSAARRSGSRRPNSTTTDAARPTITNWRCARASVPSMRVRVDRKEAPPGPSHGTGGRFAVSGGLSQATRAVRLRARSIRPARPRPPTARAAREPGSGVLVMGPVGTAK